MMKSRRLRPEALRMSRYLLSINWRAASASGSTCFSIMAICNEHKTYNTKQFKTFLVYSWNFRNDEIPIVYHGQFVLGCRKLFQKIPAVDGPVKDNLFQTYGYRLWGQVQLFQRYPQLIQRKTIKNLGICYILWVSIKMNNFLPRGSRVDEGWVGPRRPLARLHRPAANRSENEPTFGPSRQSSSGTVIAPGGIKLNKQKHD